MLCWKLMLGGRGGRSGALRNLHDQFKVVTSKLFVRHNAQCTAVRSCANTERVSQLNVPERQVGPFDARLLCADCLLAQRWECEPLVPIHFEHELVITIIFLVFEKSDCRMIPVATSEPDRLASTVLVQLEEFTCRAEHPEVVALGLVPGEVPDLGFSVAFDRVSKHWFEVEAPSYWGPDEELQHGSQPRAFELVQKTMWQRNQNKRMFIAVPGHQTVLAEIVAALTTYEPVCGHPTAVLAPRRRDGGLLTPSADPETRSLVPFTLAPFVSLIRATGLLDAASVAFATVGVGFGEPRSGTRVSASDRVEPGGEAEELSISELMLPIDAAVRLTNLRPIDEMTRAKG